MKYQGPLADYRRLKPPRRQSGAGEDNGNSRERSGASVMCRIGGCSSPVVGGKGVKGELCAMHLRLTVERTKAERKIRQRF